MMISKETTGADKVTLLTHRSAAYTEVRKLMQDKRNWTLDLTAFSLIVTAIAEHRTGDPSQAKRHLTATIDLLKSRCGLKTIQSMKFSTGMGIFNTFVTIDLPLFPSIVDLKTALAACQKTLRMLQLNHSRYELSPSLQRYLTAESRGQLGAQLAMLHVMNCILARTNPSSFLKDLDRTLQTSQGSSGLLSPLAVLFMLCSCADRAGYWNIEAKTPLRSWEAIEFVALMNLTTKGRGGFAKMLSSRLLGCDRCEMLSTNVSLEDLADEVVVTWTVQGLKGLY